MMGGEKLKDEEKFKVKIDKKVSSLLKSKDICDILSSSLIIGTVGVAMMLTGFLGALIARFVRTQFIAQASLVLLAAGMVLIIISIVITVASLLIALTLRIWKRHNGG